LNHTSIIIVSNPCARKGAGAKGFVCTYSKSAYSTPTRKEHSHGTRTAHGEARMERLLAYSHFSAGLLLKARDLLGVHVLG
jgi:hypothetical protein